MINQDDNLITHEILDRLKSQQGDITHIRETLAVFVEKTAGIVERLDKHEKQLSPMTKAYNFVQVTLKILTVFGTLAAIGLAFSRVAHAEEMPYPERIGIELAAAPSIVRVLPNSGGRCSGFVVAPNRIMTAAHCSNGPEDVGQVQFSDGQLVPYKILVQGSSATTSDVEVLSADTQNRPPIQAAASDSLPGLVLFLSARESKPTAFPAFITELETEQPSLLSQIMGAAQKEGLGHGYGQVIPGDSGSAIVNARGELCGVVTMRALDGTPNFWFVPVSQIHLFLIKAFQLPNK